MHWVSAKNERHRSSVVTSEPEYKYPIQTTLSGAVKGEFCQYKSLGEKTHPCSEGNK